MHFAHSTANPDQSDWQVLADHLKNVAELAKSRGGKFGAAAAADLAGRLHDLGKYSEAFQRYIQGRGVSVDHSTAGAQVALDLAKSCARFDGLMADVIAYLVAGHHAGLPDRSSGAGEPRQPRDAQDDRTARPGLEERGRRRVERLVSIGFSLEFGENARALPARHAGADDIFLGEFLAIERFLNDERVAV